MTAKFLGIGLMAVMTTALASPLVLADSGKHDSNTLSKVGKAVAYPVKKAAGNASKSINKGGQAVQYPVRKAGENASVTTHRALGKNSVVRRRPQKYNTVVTPKGKTYPVPTKP